MSPESNTIMFDDFFISNCLSVDLLYCKSLESQKITQIELVLDIDVLARNCAYSPAVVILTGEVVIGSRQDDELRLFI